MNAKGVLTEAARLLRDVGWTRGAYARYASGEPVMDLDDPKAACYCMIGAIRVCADDWMAESEAKAAVRDVLPGRTPIGEFNDAYGRTKEECIAKLLEAAEL